MEEQESAKVVAKSQKTQKLVEFIIEDEHLAQENYECVGMSNSDYGS